MERGLLVLGALVLNAALGGPTSWYQALGLARFGQIPARFVRGIERKLNREHRAPAEREMRGLLVVIFAVSLSLLCGWLISGLFRHNLGFIELFILALALPVRPTWDRVWQIRKHLQLHELTPARQALEGTIWRHHALLDEYGVARAGIEFLSVQFAEKILSPVFWYLLLGLEGLFLSKSIYLLQETLVSPGNVDQLFGKASSQACYLVNYLPSRLAALLWIFVSPFLPMGKPSVASQQILAGLVKSSPLQMALLAPASVLSVSLGGPTSAYIKERWIGAGTARPGPPELRRALFLFALLHVLLFVAIGAFF